MRALESLIKNKNSTKPTAKTSKPQDTIILERELSEKLCANVNITHNSSGQGKVEIKYSSLQELEGIIKKNKVDLSAYSIELTPILIYTTISHAGKCLLREDQKC